MQPVSRLLKSFRGFFRSRSSSTAVDESPAENDNKFFHTILDEADFSEKRVVEFKSLSKGICSIEFVERLKWLSAYPAVTYKSCPDVCAICGGGAVQELARDGLLPQHSAAYLWVPTADKATLFHCSDLIYHYVKRHGFQPPADFIDAVMAMPIAEYVSAIKEIESLRSHFWANVRKAVDNHQAFDWTRLKQHQHDVIAAGDGFRAALTKLSAK